MGEDVRNWQGWLSGTRHPFAASAEGWTDVFPQIQCIFSYPNPVRRGVSGSHIFDLMQWLNAVK